MRQTDLLRSILLASSGVTLLTLPTPWQRLGALSAADAPTPVPLTEPQLAELLRQLLPGITAAADQARAAFGDRRLSWGEAASLATTLSGIVSAAVLSGAPLVQGQSARALTLLIYGVLFDQVVTPRLPLWLRPFAPVIKAGAVKGLEALYQGLIKRRLAAP